MSEEGEGGREGEREIGREGSYNKCCTVGLKTIAQTYSIVCCIFYVYTYLRQNQDTHFQEGICLHRSPDQEGRSSQLYTHCRVIHQAGIPLDTHYHHHTQTHTQCSTDSGSSQTDISNQLHTCMEEPNITYIVYTYIHLY